VADAVDNTQADDGSMITYTTVIDTQSSPEATFAFMADLVNLERWDPGTKQSVQVAGDGPGLGARYDVKVGLLSMHYAVEEFHEPSSVLARGTHPFVRSTDSMRVEPRGDGSRVTYQAELTPRGPLKLLSPMLDRVFQRMGDDAAEGLARALNGRRANIHL